MAESRHHKIALNLTIHIPHDGPMGRSATNALRKKRRPKDPGSDMVKSLMKKFGTIPSPS